MAKENKTLKPVTDLLPECLHLENRVLDIAKAMAKYKEKGLEPNPNWVKELKFIAERYLAITGEELSVSDIVKSYLNIFD